MINKYDAHNNTIPANRISHNKKTENSTKNKYPSYARSNSSPSSSQPLYFIMHVGPMKTATSTIQCSLINLETQNLIPNNVIIAETQACRRLMRKDINPNGHAGSMNLCLEKWNPKENSMPKCWTEKYIPYVKEQSSHNKSIIVSQENLSWLTYAIRLKNKKKYSRNSRKFLNQLTDSLGNHRYQLVVIITYRNFFEWIYSYFNQHYSFMKRKKAKEKKQLWPNEKQIMKQPSLEKYTRDMLAETRTGRDRFHFVDRLLDFFSSGDETIMIKILNMDDDDTIIKQFLCSLPPSLSHTMCGLEDKVILEEDKLNTNKHSYWCKMLAIKAHEKGMIHSNSSTSLNDVTFDILDYQKEQGFLYENLPLICPSKDFYDLLLNKSLQVYSNVFSSSSSNNKQKMKDKELQYREKLEKMKYNFCIVNNTEILLEDKWISFLSRYSANNNIS